MKKVFLLLFVSLCFGIFAVVLWTGPAHADPQFPVPPKGGLPACQADLDMCFEELEACEAEGGQIFPGDGVDNDPFDPDLPCHGPALSYTDNLDGTFTDNNTGDTWEIKTSVAGSVHNVNNTYAWSTNLFDPNGTLFTDFLFKLNNTCQNDETVDCSTNGDADCAGVGGLCGFAGFRDWCIPNVKKLQSIVDYSMSSPASSVPPETAASFYWSSTTAPTVPSSRGASISTVASWTTAICVLAQCVHARDWSFDHLTI
jgi:hypothetical protein